jgi:F0F1-type ATP synthase assembly protein I
VADDGRDHEGDSPASGLARGYRKAQPYLNATWLMTGSTALGVGVGFELDRVFHTKPWLLLACSAVGVASGFYGFIRAMLKLGKQRT